MAEIKKIINKDGSTTYKTSVYLGRDPITNKMIKTNLTAKTQKELKLKVARKKIDYEENGKNKIKNEHVVTYLEIYQMWLLVYKNTVKESTYNKTVRMFNNHILPIFSDKQITTIDVLTCQSAVDIWFSKLERYNIVVSYCSNVLDYAVSLEVIKDNPVKKVSRPVKKIDYTEEKTKNFFTKKQLQDFFGLFKSEELMQHAFFRVLAFAGLRKGEALALTWRDLDVNGRKLRINKALSQGIDFRLMVQSPKTHSSVRSISLDDTTVLLLQKWRLKQREELFILGFNSSKDNQLIFSNECNDLYQPTVTRKWLVKVLKRGSNLPAITTHGFRHTHCSLLFESGRSIEEVKDRLGHADIQTTMNIYTHVSQEKKDEVAEGFAKYMNF